MNTSQSLTHGLTFFTLFFSAYHVTCSCSTYKILSIKINYLSSLAIKYEVFLISVFSERLGGSLSVTPHGSTGESSTAQFHSSPSSPPRPWVKWHGRSVHFDLEECLDHTANTLRELVSSFKPRMLYAILFMWPGSRTPIFLMSLKDEWYHRECAKNNMSGPQQCLCSSKPKLSVHIL